MGQIGIKHVRKLVNNPFFSNGYTEKPDRMAGTFRSTAKQCCIEQACLSLFFPADLWFVDIDKSQISQVIPNIILDDSNAMPVGGTIEAAYEYVSSPISKRNALPLSGSHVKMSIKDVGDRTQKRSKRQKNLKRAQENPKYLVMDDDELVEFVSVILTDTQETWTMLFRQQGNFA